MLGLMLKGGGFKSMAGWRAAKWVVCRVSKKHVKTHFVVSLGHEPLPEQAPASCGSLMARASLQISEHLPT